MEQKANIVKWSGYNGRFYIFDAFIHAVLPIYSWNGALMSDNNDFEIDDALGLPENLAVFVQLLETKDAALSAALGPRLLQLASGQSVDTAAIWSALYAATSTTPSDQPSGEVGEPSGGVA